MFIMKSLILSLLLSCMILEVAAQTHSYEIRYGSHVIGNIIAVQKVAGTTRKIAIQSNVDMKPLAKFNLNIDCDYDNNVLVLANAKRTTGKEGDNKYSITKRDGKNYSINHNGEQSVLNNTDIVHTVSELYFFEPHHITSIFSELQGAFLPLKSLGNGLYELTLPEGKKNVYKYEKGTLVQVEIPQAFGKAVVVKIS